MPKPYEILSVERVFDGFFAVDRANVRFELVGGGMSAPHERLCVERGDSAAVLLHDVAGGVFLLGRQFRYAGVRHGDAWVVEAIAGKIDGAETPESAARREALEEAGYDVREMTRVGAFYGSPGGMSELTHVFYARVDDSNRVADGGGVDAGEDVEIVAVPVDVALRQAVDGEIRDGKALIALLWYAARMGA